MSKQFRVYIVPSDIQSTLNHLRSKVGLKILEETAPGPKPIEVESPVRKGAENFIQNGGKLATGIRPDGEPTYVDE